MFTSTTATVSISPVQLFLGGIALGVGIFAGQKACDKLEKVAAASVLKMRAKKETAPAPETK